MIDSDGTSLTIHFGTMKQERLCWCNRDEQPVYYEVATATAVNNDAFISEKVSRISSAIDRRPTFANSRNYSSDLDESASFWKSRIAPKRILNIGSEPEELQGVTHPLGPVRHLHIFESIF